MSELTIFNRHPVTRRSNFVDFYNLIDDFFGQANVSRPKNVNTFKMDLKEEDKAYSIEAELAGIKKDEIKLSYENDILEISVERKDEKEEEKDDYVYRERSVSSMQRRLRLVDVDEDGIEAELKDGILTVRLPKVEAKDKRRTIDVK